MSATTDTLLDMKEEFMELDQEIKANRGELKTIEDYEKYKAKIDRWIELKQIV